VRTNRISTLAFALLVVGASAATAVACPNNDKSASTASKTGGCPYAHSSNASATLASTAHEDGCGASAKAASATHESGCGMSKSAVAGGSCSMHGAAAGSCTFGKNAVTMAGDMCPTAHEADYAFAVKGADCQGTSQSAAKAIKAMKGVASVTVDYKAHMAYVCADGRTCDESQIVNCLKKAGFADAKFVNADHANCAKSHGKVPA
jgi:copper chaperone CopZ